MQFVTENFTGKDKALIVTKSAHPLVKKLGEHLATYDHLVDIEIEYPPNISAYNLVYIFAEGIERRHIMYYAEQETSIVIVCKDRKTFNTAQDILEEEDVSFVKIIYANYEDQSQDTVDSIVWFSLSESDEKSLNIFKETDDPSQGKIFKKKKLFAWTKKKIFLLVFSITIAFESFFILPATISSYYLYTSGVAVKDQRMKDAERLLEHAEPYLHAAQITYKPARPLLSLFLIALPMDNLLGVQEDVYVFIDVAIKTHDDAQQLSQLILDTRINDIKTQQTADVLADIKTNIAELKKRSGNIRDKIDLPFDSTQKLKTDMDNTYQYLTALDTILPHADEILGSNDTKKYVLYFYNNMELRPGGGFIGSFALVTFEKYTLKDFTVFDVYDADGQLKAHVNPPEPIKKYLEQPHWYLRDSNFSPDFEQNVKIGNFFLKEELGIDKVDGSVGVTATALTYMLEAFGDVYLSDYNESINADNFYIKAQTESEEDFFEGSHQKKSYLSSVGRTLMLKLETSDKAQLAIALQKSLQEKHIVLNFTNKSIQKSIDASGWSGKLIKPQCVVSEINCITNIILPIQANLGVNKANYFTETYMTLTSKLSNDGNIHHTLSTTFKNNSFQNTFPGGTYRNYYQTFIPENAEILKVDLDGTKITDFDVSNTYAMQSVGTFFSIPPALTKTLTIEYVQKNVIQSGNNVYQILVQKQIGALNKDFSFTIEFPEGMYVTHSNFESLAKNNTVSYNSILSTDKIFVIQFINEGLQ